MLKKMSSRRVLYGRLTRAGGHRRKSPRISALDAWRSEPEPHHILEKKGQPSRATTTRDRIKRKHHQHHAVASSNKKASQVEDGRRSKNESNKCGKASTIPEKKVLEHILDTLQRKDTYEIFAEPVDPDEVVDYYEIIKEPMDFATMRAKLHEGMYENLEQFKHDAFLITENAMHFNSSSTIYFRQARAIHELSKRVFHVLETDPENFELEFLGTRRRSARRADIEAKDCKISTEIKPILTTNAAPKDKPRPVVASVHERNRRGTPKSATVTSRSNRRNKRNFVLGARDGRSSNNTETDRRCTYRPQKFTFLNNTNIFDSKCSKSELFLTNEQDFNYRESLLLFVRHLGPTAQMIAARKIQGLQENPIFQAAGASNRSQATSYQEPAPHASKASASHNSDDKYSSLCLRFTDSISRCRSLLEKTAGRIELSNAEEDKEAYGKGRTSSHGASDKEILECNEASSLPRGINVPGAPRRGRPVQNHKSTESCLGASNANARDLNSSIVSKTSTNAKSTSLMVNAVRFDENVRPVILALEHSRANSSEAKLKNKKSCTPSTSFSQNRASASHMNGSRNSFSISNQAMAATKEKKGSSAPHEATQYLMEQPITIPIPTPAVSGFTFDVNFLKAKLNQMKVVGRNKELNKQGVDGEEVLIFKQESYSYNRDIPNNSSVPSFPINESLDSLDTELALQL